MAKQEPTIKGCIRLNGRKFVKGNEAELRAVATPEQLAQWDAQGLLEGDWETGEASPSLGEATLETIAARINSGLGVDRLPTESPLQFLDRFSHSCEEVAKGFEDELKRVNTLHADAEAKLAATQSELESVKAELENTKTQLADAQEDLNELGPHTHSDTFAKQLEDVVGAPAAKSIIEGGFDSAEKLAAATDEQLKALKDVGDATVKKLSDWRGAK